KSLAKNVQELNKANLDLANERTRLKQELRRSQALLFNSTFRESVDYFVRNDFAGTRLSLDDCRWDLRGGEYAYLAKLVTQKVRFLYANNSAVVALVMSADGKRLYSGSYDKTIKVWDLDAGNEILTLRGHTDSVTSLVLSPDGKRLYSGSKDTTIKVWDLNAG